ncbi:hypothetical protein GCM10028784_16580 [Myceligenerans cantabricum]
MPVVETSEPGRSCLLCGSIDDPTDEHIVPQTLWNEWGLDPNSAGLARYRCTLCRKHNGALSALHSRPEMKDLIVHGGPVNKRTLRQFADWAVWVTMELGLARGTGVLDEAMARKLLLDHADGGVGGPPAGMRVYAALVDEQPATAVAVPKFEIAVKGDDRISYDESGEPSGFSVREGRIKVAESIVVGHLAVIVLGRTLGSGPDHRRRLDAAAAVAGLAPVHPLPNGKATLSVLKVPMSALNDVFVPPGLGSDTSLLPKQIRAVMELFDLSAAP